MSTSSPPPQPEPPSEMHFRVVGVRADGTREVLASRLTSFEHAQCVREFLGDMREFLTTIIERE
ncbi:MAG: hypothetical protein ACT4QC_16275 [Planctomycetaceae bacterium]